MRAGFPWHARNYLGPRMLEVFLRSCPARALVVAALLSCSAPRTPQTSDAAPTPLTAEALERFITCYPREDTVREGYRMEVARLELHHKAELDQLYQQLLGGNGRHPAPSPDAMILYGRERTAWLDCPQAITFFSLSCGAAGLKASLTMQPLSTPSSTTFPRGRSGCALIWTAWMHFASRT